VLAAELLAHHGVEFTEIQRTLRFYYAERLELNKIKRGEKPLLQEALEIDHVSGIKKPWTQEQIDDHRADCEKTIHSLVNEFCQTFITAIDAGDSKKIRDIADAIDFVKSFEPSGDQFRARILAEKSLCEKQGRKLTIRELARWIQWPMRDSKDGFSRLRRICRELNFPIAPSRQIRSK
jgi:hypothetical protein